MLFELKYGKIESTNYFGDDMSIDDYRPTYTVEAVYDLRANDLLRQGISAVLVDLDNTLIAWNNPDGTPEVRAWLDEMTIADISVVVVSNNNHARVERAVSRFGVDFISRAMKPFAYGIDKAIDRYGFDREEVIMVGDQLMTDIRASHRAGIKSVLVKPLVVSDAWNTKINRWRERRVMAKLEEKYGKLSYQKGI
ncbi:YqeG family HAD IIIA-type phosphatase [Streptococcus dysgalactiae]|nr:HAD phosphatase, family IIIA [Streptococcus dysgalactiae subsp. equisimilis SK1250]QFZ09046.1 YqeG family HAD IIIA-type phosphatase [Streptococcus dysgalactiae]TYL01750.1 YqeG family HAD IIIA-type phosphatase [Streptococcus dysgalactiae]